MKKTDAKNRQEKWAQGQQSGAGLVKVSAKLKSIASNQFDAIDFDLAETFSRPAPECFPCALFKNIPS
jgi:hypothetical protein